MPAVFPPTTSPAPQLDYSTLPPLLPYTMVTNGTTFAHPRPKDVGIHAIEMYFPRRVSTDAPC